ncbi:hypothetical protein GP486_008872, partial [Trichoglossum hirsutum]
KHSIYAFQAPGICIRDSHVADDNISPRDLKDELNDKLSWKLQEVVAMYYNDPAITLGQFAKHCTTNDQQIRTRLERRDRAAGKPDSTRKATPEQAPTRRTGKTIEGKRTPQPRCLEGSLLFKAKGYRSGRGGS